MRSTLLTVRTQRRGSVDRVMRKLLALSIFIWLVGSTIVNAANVRLDWVAPTEREDGFTLSLSEISSFKIYYGSIAGDYQNTVTISDNTVTTYDLTIDTVPPHYIVMTTVDSYGRESVYSEMVTVVILLDAPVVVCEPNADLNSDGIVDLNDFSIFKSHWGKQF